MNEGEIRQYAEMQALLLEAKAIEIEVEGMKAENMQRGHLGQSMAYSDEAFGVASIDLRKIIDRLRTEI